jgi:hypothetical protein
MNRGGGMFEHHKQPMASRSDFLRRVLRFSLLATAIILLSLGIGIVGYHYIVHLSWIDSTLNASMLLGGMGPVAVQELNTTPEKLFASFYALFAGMIFLVAIGVLATPIFHRFLHHFHLELEDD